MDVTPLGKRSIPKPQDRTAYTIGLLFALCFTRFFAGVFENVHHTHAVCPLWRLYPPLDCRQRSSELINKPKFYQSNSSKNALEFKTKNIKMKLSLESGDDFMKTASSWIASVFCLDHENPSQNARFLQHFGKENVVKHVGAKNTIFIKCTKHLVFRLFLGPKEKTSSKTTKNLRLLNVLSWAVLGRLPFIVIDRLAILVRTPRHLQKQHHSAAVCSFS